LFDILPSFNENTVSILSCLCRIYYAYIFTFSREVYSVPMRACLVSFKLHIKATQHCMPCYCVCFIWSSGNSMSKWNEMMTMMKYS